MLTPYRRQSRTPAGVVSAVRTVAASELGRRVVTSAAKAIGSKVYEAASGYVRRLSQRSQPSTATQSLNSGTSRRVRGKDTKTKARRSRKPKTKQAKMSAQIKDIQKKMSSSLSLITYRVSNTARGLAAVNQQQILAVSGSSISSLEGVLAQLRFFNPAVPGTLITADLASPSFAQTIRFKSQFCRVTFRNNYQTPCHLKVYASSPKDDTNITFGTAWTNGLADNASGALTSTDPGVYISDSKQLSELWKVQKKAKALLQPGDELVFVYSTDGFDFDPSYADSHNVTYQRAYKSYSIDAFVQGVIGHDTALDQQGLLAAGVDYEVERVWKVEYDAGGIDLDYIYMTSAYDAFTNGGVISSKPVADNIGYSVA